MCGDVGCFMSEVEDEDHPGKTIKEAEVSVMTAVPSSRRKGIAREAVTLVEEYCRTALGVDRFIAKIRVSNKASRAMFASLGYTEVKIVEMLPVSRLPAPVFTGIWVPYGVDGKSRSGPYNYIPSKRTEVETNTIEMEREELRKKQAEDRIREEALAKEAAEIEARRSQEAERLSEVKKDEELLLEKHSRSLRHYLLENVMPTLKEGIVEACEKAPEDGVTFLAESVYLSSPN
ncbi:N-acetyltransferase 9 [Perkinsus olseni]|uniref:N-acetyltransferase 9 n=1 Tax=Perkinsus olseni TaxID=32597 RepID=A0A7J6P6W0_PEROL|nr:N-acetyltransferase 9 [Perkinsus olseni]